MLHGLLVIKMQETKQYNKRSFKLLANKEETSHMEK
jgi:hypothetical protein